MASEAVKLAKLEAKRAKAEHRWQREKALIDLFSQPAVINPIMGVGGALVLQKSGQARVIDRDFAGFLLAAWTAYCAANAGIHDKWALGAITASATAAYAVTVPPRDDETLVELHPSKLLGGDGKLFWWDLSWIPGIAQLS